MRLRSTLLWCSLLALASCGRSQQSEPKVEYPARVNVPESIQNEQETPSDGIYVLGAPIYLVGHNEGYLQAIGLKYERYPHETVTPSEP